MVPQRTFQYISVLSNGSRGDRSEPTLIEQHEARGEDLIARFLREEIEGSRSQHSTGGVSHERAEASFARGRADS